MSASPGRATPVLRVALSTWPRHDRRESGEVLLATAQELIDEGGSSAGREALGLARSGAAVRARHLVRDCLSGSWSDAAALAIIGCALIISTLVSAATGGPLEVLRSAPGGSRGALTTYGPDGASSVIAQAAPALIVTLALASAVLAAARVRVGALLAILATAALFVVSYSTPSSEPITFQAALQYANKPFPQTSVPAPREAFVDLGGVLGLLLFVAAITACAWLATSVVGRQSHLASKRRRLTPGQVATLGGASLASVVVGPVFADQLGAWVGRALDVAPETVYTSPASIAAGWSTVFVVVIVGLVAAAAPRRKPAAAMAAVVVGIALWIPALWLGTGVFLGSGSLPWAGITGEDASILIFWLLTALIGLALGAAVLRTAGRATRTGLAASTPAPPDEPLLA